MIEEEEEQYVLTPPNLAEKAKSIENDLLPKRSKKKYLLSYDNFLEWLKQNKAPLSERVMLCYFTELSERMKPSTLWSYFSRLKTTIRLKKNIDVGKYATVLTFIKRLNDGYEAKSASVLTVEEVKTFIELANDEMYLCIKVILIFGLMGALRMCESFDITVKNVEWHGNDLLLVKIPGTSTKNKEKKSFTIQGQYIDYVRRYVALRPKNLTKTDKFFIQYKNGKCTSQPIGINTFRGIPKIIAEYLSLPNPEQYTGHCFRRTSTTILANAGASTSRIKLHTGHKSNTAVDLYTENSLSNKKKTGDMLITEISGPDSVRVPPVHNVPKPSSITTETDNTFTNVPGLISIPFADPDQNFVSQLESNNDNDLDHIITSQSEMSQVIQYEIFDSNTANVVNKSKPKFTPKAPVFYKFYNCTVNINN